MKKIELVNGTTIDGASTFNQMQDNVEEVFNGEEAMGSIVVEDIKCRQLFNKDEVIENYYLGYTDGTPTWDSNMAYMQSYIEVKPSSQYTMSYSSATIFIVHEYDENKNFLSYSVQNDSNNFLTITTSSDTKYVRLSCGKSAISKMMFVKGSVIPDDYIEYKKFGYNSQESMGKIIVDDISSKNKFDINKLTSGTINGITLTKQKDGGIVLNGTATAQAEFYYIETVDGNELKTGQTYTLSSNDLQDGVLAFLQNSNSATWVSSIAMINSADNPVTFSMPSVAGTHYKYLILVTAGTILNNFVLYPQLEKGDKVTPYTPYKNFEGRTDIVTGQECPTNEYVDGKRVYVKRVNFGALPNATNKAIELGLTDIVLVRIEGVATSGSLQTFIPSMYTQLTMDNGWLNILTTNNMSSYGAIVNIYYTKYSTSSVSTTSLEETE